MTIIVFNVLKSLLELFLHAYLPWLDPAHYIDISRSLLLAKDGSVYIRRRSGRVPLPIVWHDHALTRIRAIIPIIISVVVFIVNQAAFDVDTAYRTTRAQVITCDSTNGTPGLHNTREGLTHLLRVTASCRANSIARAAVPSWADGALNGTRIIYGAGTYRCRSPLDVRIMADVDYCYNGNYRGNSCSGNMVSGHICNTSFEAMITQAGIPKQGAGVLCHAPLENGVLFWVGNMTQGLSIRGVTEFAPSTLELMRRALDASPTFLRSRITRVLDAEATVRDRPMCTKGVSGRVQTDKSYSVIVIIHDWWLANGVLVLVWMALRRRCGGVFADFSATGCCDRLRAEAAGDGCGKPE